MMLAWYHTEIVDAGHLGEGKHHGAQANNLGNFRPKGLPYR